MNSLEVGLQLVDSISEDPFGSNLIVLGTASSPEAMCNIASKQNFLTGISKEVPSMLSFWLYWKSNSITFLLAASVETFERVSLSVLPDGLTWTWATPGKYLHSFYLALSLLFLIVETEG